MDFNPLLLMPLLMMNNKNGNNMNIEKMAEMMQKMQSSTKDDALMSMLGVDDKTKAMLSLLNNKKETKVEQNDKDIKKDVFKPTFFTDDVNMALKLLMDSKNK